LRVDKIFRTAAAPPRQCPSSARKILFAQVDARRVFDDRRILGGARAAFQPKSLHFFLAASPAGADNRRHVPANQVHRRPAVCRWVFAPDLRRSHRPAICHRRRIDHVLPILRGGTQTPDNIEGICDRCNQIKGNMTKEEYQQLLAAIRDFQPVTKASILARLRAGARSIYN
jgi:HNH endonuclease